MGDPHQQTLARLDWELEQRKRLALFLPDLVDLYNMDLYPWGQCFVMTLDQTVLFWGTSRMIS